MKVEDTQGKPAFNFLEPDGQRPQADSKVITDVLLTDGQWYPIVPGSFKFYVTGTQKPVPFLQFDVTTETDDARRSHPLAGKRIECLPNSFGGVAYVAEEESDVG